MRKKPTITWLDFELAALRGERIALPLKLRKAGRPSKKASKRKQRTIKEGASWC